MELKAPFPYFGGKSSIAGIVWQALGDVKHYIEPFFGSGAVLLKRPNYTQGVHVETVCDKDGLLANVWRALQADPDAVAKHCDWPVNHADLCARRVVLNAEKDMLQKLLEDPYYHDVKLAGYWIWAASCWIGHGLTHKNARPHLANSGKGVHAIGKIPHLLDGGKGVHAIGQIPHLADGGNGVQDPYNTNIYQWFRELSERLRYVRVVCGDWTRVCGGNWQDKMGTVGMFFDPPYSDTAERDPNLYAEDSLSVAHDVREWCKARGDNPRYRIVLAGYYEEHEELLDSGWRAQKWKANGGYSNLGKGKNENRHKETLFMSPHCNVAKEADLLGVG